MNCSIEAPVYSKIALDIAARIARGELKLNEKISGRSLMASEYSVSPETIRRSFKLLADVNIIEVMPNSGAVVISREKALEYVERYNTGRGFRSLRKELKALLKERDEVNQKILNIIDEICDLSERFKNTNPLNTLEFEIPENSPVENKSIEEIKFWQKTGATIVGIKRDEKMILSPGPYSVFKKGDVLIVTGDAGIAKRIEDLIN